MNIGRFAAALLVAFAFCFLLLGQTHAQSAVAFDLAVTDIETQPYTAGVGDETSYAVTIENLHPAPVPPDLDVDLILSVVNAQSEVLVANCRQGLDMSLLSGEHRAMRVPVENCSAILQEPAGTHLVRADLVEAGQELADDGFVNIPGDLNAGNNGAITTIIPVAEQSDDNLPTELTRIFAGLAIFFAVMALVAAGAEVAIDSLKVAVGLKRKVTSTEALDRMEKYLPGQLGALSVSATTQEEFRRMIREMRSVLNDTLQGVENIAELREQIAASEFGPLFRRADAISRAQNSLTARDLYNFKKYMQAYVTTVLNTVEGRLQLSGNYIKPLRDQLAQEISLFDGGDPQAFMTELMHDLQNPQFWSAQIVDGWLGGKQQNDLMQDRVVVAGEFEGEIMPILLGVGFAQASVDALLLELAARLGVVEASVSQSTDTFIVSVRNVLDAVELRRYDTQSPARKLWRKLRGWQGGAFPPLRLRSTIMPAVYSALFLLYLAALKGLIGEPLLARQAQRSSGLFEHSPWLSWFLLFFIVSFALVLLIFFALKSIGANERQWFIGLYGATALAAMVSAGLTLLLWILQPFSANRVSGELLFFDWLQPWWSWFINFGLILLVLLMISSLVGKYLYDRLVRTAVRDGRLSSGNDALENATVILRVETLWNLIRQGFDITRVVPDQFLKPDTVADYEHGTLSNGEQGFNFAPETAAQFIMQRSDQQRDEETSRLRILRVLSIIVGLVIAYVLQIDVLILLGEAFPQVTNQLDWTIVSGPTLHAWRSWLPIDKSLTVGMVLTAFAASAGSAFWHDRLDQLQASKKSAQAATRLLNQASQVMDSTK